MPWIGAKQPLATIPGTQK